MSDAREPPGVTKVNLSGSPKGHFYADTDIDAYGVSVCELFELEAEDTSAVSITIETELGDVGLWLELDEAKELLEGLEEAIEYVDARVEDEFERLQKVRGSP